ncbi:PREDICTED: uncharacterized protein LOC108608999 [Drosophila arizonae]|uniref:Uncharacterized protein LOC108608999 n=1 Tax=Drosophila arizonae TaxID=7263 RepID=A0ABM1NMG8_DROAR|nr:PREDICTED: uncharacterized protein LOC108608999 [Drosophila arizonae]
MSTTATVIVISVWMCLVLAKAQDVSIELTLQRGVVAERTLRAAIEEKLPPTAEAQQDGAYVLDTFLVGLKGCETQLRANKQVAEYNNCVSTLQGLAMASVGELAGQHWARSGASRPTLFW